MRQERSLIFNCNVLTTKVKFQTSQGFQAPGKRGHIVADTNVKFPRLSACAKFVSDTNLMFLILFRNILYPQQMFPRLGSPRNTMSNNVSATMSPRLPRQRFGTTGEKSCLFQQRPAKNQTMARPSYSDS